MRAAVPFVTAMYVEPDILAPTSRRAPPPRAAGRTDAGGVLGGARPGGPSAGDSVTEAVAEAVRIVRASGLPNRDGLDVHHARGRVGRVHGRWSGTAATRSARYGTRVSLVLKADIRPGHIGELTAKVERVERLLAP